MIPVLQGSCAGLRPQWYLDDFICSSEGPPGRVWLALKPVLQLQKQRADMPSKVAGERQRWA